MPLPSDTQILLAIREDLQNKVAPDVQSPMAADVCRMAIDLISRLLVRRIEWPNILRARIAALDVIIDQTRAVSACAARAEPLLSSADQVVDPPPSHDASLAQLEAYSRAQARLLSQWLPIAMSQAANNAIDSKALQAIMSALVEAENEREAAVDAAAAASRDAYRAMRIAAEASLAPEDLEAYLRRRFPDRPAIKLTDMRELSGGFGKTTIVFEVEGLEEDRASSLVMRRDRKAGATEATVEDEYPLLEALKGLDLRAPEPLWLEPDPTELALPFMIVRRMPGRIAGSLWAPDPEVCGPETALDLARILARLHAVPLERLPFSKVEAGGAPSEALARSIAYITDLWHRTQQEPDPVMDMCLKWLELNQPPPPERITLVHGDIGFQNLLVKDRKISALLDWELAHPGDPNEDLCYVRPYIEQLIGWGDFLEEYRAHGGCEYLADRTDFYAVWREVRNTVFAGLCHKAFCNDETADTRFGHTGFVYFRMMLLGAARKIIALQPSVSQPAPVLA